ncbi:nucleoside triphosphate pyrophosphohydrolase [Candidatus Babeliales bacterium]|nr:nucleoside triphosphate pyrophosphohydrolase [Candidatus Babeliales bacterium]MBP9843690.1 nucleoside triphosphate pyrophosphohydrolase [Candidatus Babeliales bacterium]
MRKFYQNMIWRDKLIKMREEKGAIVHVIPLAHAEFKEELGMKLLQEANDVYAADTHDKMVDEIVDVLEAIDCLLDFHGIPKEEIIALKAKKLAEFGSYTDHRLVDYVEYPVGSAEEKHCLDNPDKFPELDDEEVDGEHSINTCCK